MINKRILNKNFITITFIVLLVIYLVIANFDTGQTQIENNITEICGDGYSTCPHWLESSALDTGANCFNSTAVGLTNGYCRVAKVGATYGWFKINSSPDGNPNIVPAGENCYFTVNLINLSDSEIDESINVTINSVTQTIADPGGNSTGNEVKNATASNKFSFIGGSVGADNITFTAAGTDDVDIDYFYIHDCENPTNIPELSDFAVVFVLVVVIGGFLIVRRKKNN